MEIRLTFLKEIVVLISFENQPSLGSGTCLPLQKANTKEVFPSVNKPDLHFVKRRLSPKTIALDLALRSAYHALVPSTRHRIAVVTR